MFYRYEIKNNGIEDILYLYLDMNNEYSKELSYSNDISDLTRRTKNFVKNTGIDFKGNKVYLVIDNIVVKSIDIKNNDMESYLCKDDDLKEVYKNLIKTLKEKNINVSFRMSYGFPGRYELNCFYNVQNYITFPHDIVNDIIRLSTDKPIDGVNDIVCRMRTFDYDCPTLYKDIYLPNELENENIKGNQKRISLNSRI